MWDRLCKKYILSENVLKILNFISATFVTPDLHAKRLATATDISNIILGTKFSIEPMRKEIIFITDNGY